MPHKIWAVGEEVLAADFQTYLQNQVVATFPNAAARDAAITAPASGQMAWVADVRWLTVYDGGWRGVPGTIIGQSMSNAAQATTSAAGVALPGSSIALTFAFARTVRVDVNGGMQTLDTLVRQGRLTARMDGGGSLCSYQAVLNGSGAGAPTQIVGAAWGLVNVPAGAHTFDVAVLSPQGANINGLASTRLVITETGLTGVSLRDALLDSEQQPDDGDA